MENLRRQFLSEAAANLRRLSDEFQSAATISDSVKHEAFRTLHTIKGTAQTLGFDAPSHLSHQLESLLSIATDKKSAEADSFKNIFLEGINYLIKLLENQDFQIPDAFGKKIHELLPTLERRKILENDSGGIPTKIFSQLTVNEKIVARAAQSNNKNLFCFEVVYDLANFADCLINFRNTLGENGEIIATLPGTKNVGNGRIGFKILYASASEKSKIEQILTENNAKIIFSSASKKTALAQMVEHGKTIAEQLNKKIEFEFSGDEINLPPNKLKLIFDAALHLIRNAVDHGIETSGKIEIDLRNEKNGWHLTVADDGHGIDLEKINRLALEKNLINEAEDLPENELIRLIFQPQFSTKTDVSEISGRGVGLDAVKCSIEKAGGTIKIRSGREHGTAFEIFLPE